MKVYLVVFQKEDPRITNRGTLPTRIVSGLLQWCRITFLDQTEPDVSHEPTCVL